MAQVELRLAPEVSRSEQILYVGCERRVCVDLFLDFAGFKSVRHRERKNVDPFFARLPDDMGRKKGSSSIRPPTWSTSAAERSS
jgi:hypothetical protein